MTQTPQKNTQADIAFRFMIELVPIIALPAFAGLFLGKELEAGGMRGVFFWMIPLTLGISWIIGLVRYRALTHKKITDSVYE